jgi:FMN reductase
MMKTTARDKPLIVGIGGTNRSPSTSQRALAATLAMCEARGARTLLIAGPDIDLPSYDPRRSARGPQAQRLVEGLRAADGVIIATPSYHGSISGLVKNALDYVEDLRDDPDQYLSGRAVGTIVCAEGAQAIGATLVTVRSIIHALRGWPTPYAAAIDSTLEPFGADGSSIREPVRLSLAVVAEQVVEFAQMRRAWEISRGATPAR